MTGSISKPEARTPRRWYEGSPLMSLRDEMDDLFHNFFGAPAQSRLPEMSVPSIDVSETESAIEVVTDVPGINADDVHIEVRDGVLSISGQTSEKKESEEGDGRKFHRIERRSGSFARSLRLPCSVDQDKIDAEMKDGVLTVTLPKAEEARGRKVTIRQAV